MVLDATVNALHVVVGAVWIGSILFVTAGVLPVARDGDLSPDAIRRIVGRVTTISRLSALVALLTGGHLAATRYTAASLFDAPNGHLVLTMVALWFLLAATVEIGAKRVTDGLNARQLREPARAGLRWYRIASVLGVLLLIDAALLT